ncbi:Probable lipoprotein [plant metagenome]|uniref:Probable lipoprotein n=3 Tax=root TaxID=1 RepID=A0A1C3K1V6_9BURK|nr:Probable lipoprotein [Orrella dioscoreae]SOE46316.1 Probable lipoprotein [Orrella dioscoreae]
MTMPVLSLPRRLARVGAIAAVTLLAACAQAPKPLYHWGGYQDQVYAHFKGTDGDPVAQIGAMEKQIEEARAADMTLPPGFHAHLGMLYAQVGRDDAVLPQFQTEKTLFPESAVFMDVLMKQPKEKAQ